MNIDKHIIELCEHVRDNIYKTGAETYSDDVDIKRQEYGMTVNTVSHEFSVLIPDYNFITPEQARWHDAEEGRMIDAALIDMRDQIPEKLRDDESEAIGYLQENQMFNEYEAEWFEPAMINFSIWNSDRDSKYKIKLALLYKDAPYYMEKHEEVIFFKEGLYYNDMRTLTGEQIMKWIDDALNDLHGVNK